MAFPAVFAKSYKQLLEAAGTWLQRMEAATTGDAYQVWGAVSYRRIFLLSVLRKILERFIQRRLTTHLESTKGL